MTIQRQYSLPNCKLVLEGLSRAALDPATQIGRPSLDVLIRFECHLPNQGNPLMGGRDLLENLAAATSQCAQEFLSGIRRADRFTLDGHSPSAQLKNVATNQFRLIVPSNLLFDSALLDKATLSPESTSDNAKKLPSTELNLSIVQVFDLVEAFDQLLADTQTLPDLSLKFSPLPRRETASRQPTTQQVAPIALGVTSLGLAGAAFFFVPIPEVRKPEAPALKEPVPSQTNPEQPSSPQIPNRSPEPSPSPDQRSSLVAPLATAPIITDRQQLRVLNQKLHTQITQTWKTKPPFYQDLIYRVGVNRSGQIVGYRPVNQAAIDYRQAVPLLDLLKISVPVNAALKSESTTQEGLAQFQVVFTSSGKLQIRPWGDG